MNFNVDIIVIMQGLALLGVLLNFVMLLVSTLKRVKTEEGKANLAEGKKHIVVTGLVGVLANFFDTLGIGSFAPSASAYKLTKSVDDALVPGTLNVGDTIPVCLEAFFFFTAFEIDGLTCFAMCASATLGAFTMAGIVSKWSRKKVRLGFGIGLFVLAIIMLCKQLEVGPFGGIGEATGLSGIKLVVGCAINFCLGAAMCLGVGLYAPCMALCVLLGLNTNLAFPLMMGSCAYLMAFGNGPKFILEGKFDIVASWANALGGAVGVFIAVYLVKSLELTVLTYIVIFVCFLTAVLYFRDYSKMKSEN